MKEKQKITGDCGIIIGRFQVPDLHEAHIDLIQSVIDRHPKVFIFLGLSPLKTTFVNPLDFEARKQMILQKFPSVNVLYIKDEREDDIWSKKLDNQINDILGPNQTAVLYGSRDSFIPFYKGKFNVIELEPTRIVSGTELRKEASNRVKSTPDFRYGVIHAVGNQYPTVFTTVDVAILDLANERTLLAKKPNEKLYRFVGGFADPKSESFEQDVKREVIEETGLEIADVKYLGSCLIKDWRYEHEVNKIKTLFFVGNYVFGGPVANDDISEVRWFKLTELKESVIVPEHRPLLEMFLEYLKTKTTDKLRQKSVDDFDKLMTENTKQPVPFMEDYQTN